MDLKDIQDLAEQEVNRGSTRAEVTALMVLAIVELVKELELLRARMPPRE